jgi:hypothetical protein
MRARTRKFQQRGQCACYRHRLHFGAGRHQFARRQVSEPKRAIRDARLRGLNNPCLLHARHQQPELLDAVHAFVTGGWLESGEPQHAVADAVQECDRPAKDRLEDADWPCHPQGRRFGTLQGEALRRELAEHDVQHGYQREGCGGGRTPRDFLGHRPNQRRQRRINQV